MIASLCYNCPLLLFDVSTSRGTTYLPFTSPPNINNPLIKTMTMLLVNGNHFTQGSLGLGPYPSVYSECLVSMIPAIRELWGLLFQFSEGEIPLS